MYIWCDSYAAEYDINFNPDNSKFLVIPATIRRHLYNAMCKCCFFVRNKMIDNVDRFSHVGHIIRLTSSLLDGDDIVQRRNTFVGQTNNVLCFLINYIVISWNCLSRTALAYYMEPNFGQCQYWDRLYVLHGVRLSGVYITINITPTPILSS